MDLADSAYIRVHRAANRWLGRSSGKKVVHHLFADSLNPSLSSAAVVLAHMLPLLSNLYHSRLHDACPD